MENYALQKWRHLLGKIRTWDQSTYVYVVCRRTILIASENFGRIFSMILFQEGTSGPIGTAIKGLNENLLPFVDFVRIQTNVPILDRSIFLKKEELLMLYDLCHGIANGFLTIDPAYLFKKLGEISNVRWRTTWIRLLRLYIQTLNPSPELVALVNFILKGPNLPIF